MRIFMMFSVQVLIPADSLWDDWSYGRAQIYRVMIHALKVGEVITADAASSEAELEIEAAQVIYKNNKAVSIRENTYARIRLILVRGRVG